MSRNITFYAEKNRNPETRIKLYWTGNNAAETLVAALNDLSYVNNKTYIQVDKAAKEISMAIDDEIEDSTNKIKEYEANIDESRRFTNISSVELYHRIICCISEYRRLIRESQDLINFYKDIKQTLIAILNLEFLQAKNDGSPSEWELYVEYNT